MATSNLSATQRASALLITLGPERAAKVFKHLSDTEIERLSLEISKLRRIDSREMDEIIEDFYGLCVTQKVITEGGFFQAISFLLYGACFTVT